MGQCCCGVLKALSLGGLGIWVTIDYLIFLINSLTQSESIHALGFVAVWEKSTITPAFLVAMFMVSMWCCSVCCQLAGPVGAAPSSPRKKDEESSEPSETKGD